MRTNSEFPLNAAMRWSTIRGRLQESRNPYGHPPLFSLPPELPGSPSGRRAFRRRMRDAGDAGSGPSEIRKYILENDLLEAIIALPNDIFYNTGIATYIWVLSNKKAGTRREGKVQLINV